MSDLVSCEWRQVHTSGSSIVESRLIEVLGQKVQPLLGWLAEPAYDAARPVKDPDHRNFLSTLGLAFGFEYSSSLPWSRSSYGLSVE